MPRGFCTRYRLQLPTGGIILGKLMHLARSESRRRDAPHFQPSMDTDVRARRPAV
jgi:hypothetical protein